MTGCDPGDQVVDDELEGESWILEEDLRVDEADDFFFARPTNLDVAEDGTMLIADSGEHEVKVLSPEGELLDTIGRHGEGPGEFTGPRDVRLARGDSLYVLSGHGRISVFAPDTYAFARSFEIDRTGGFGHPLSLFVPEQGGFLIRANNPSQTGGPEAKTFYRVNDHGQDAEWLDVPQYGPQNVRIPIEQGIVFGPMPFSRQFHAYLGSDDRVYHGISDSLAITQSELDGTTVRHWSLPVTPELVAQEDLEEYLEGRPPDWREAVRDAELEDTHPFFHRILVDDEERVWVKREDAEPDPETGEQRLLWWVVSAEGELRAETHVPAEVHVADIKDGHVYGVIRDQDYQPAVVRYRIADAS